MYVLYIFLKNFLFDSLACIFYSRIGELICSYLLFSLFLLSLLSPLSHYFSWFYQKTVSSLYFTYLFSNFLLFITITISSSQISPFALSLSSYSLSTSLFLYLSTSVVKVSRADLSSAVWRVCKEQDRLRYESFV